MKVLAPITLTDAMLSSSTIAEPAAGETAWVSAAAHTLGDQRIRATTHKVYEALITHTGRTALPEVDTTYWLEIGPTAKWAVFDTEISTASTIVTPLTYVLRPGFFNAIAFYGLDGTNISVSVKDAPAGAVIYSYSGDLLSLPMDWYDWAFGPIKTRTKLILDGITPYPDAELTLTITAAVGVTVGAGMIVVGDLRAFMGEVDWGGVEYGVSAEPVNYSRISTDQYGTTRIVNGRSVTDMRGKVVMPRDAADYFLANVQEVLSTPCAWIATEAAGYEGLNVFGLGSGAMSYDSFGHAVFSFYVKGLV